MVAIFADLPVNPAAGPTNAKVAAITPAPRRRRGKPVLLAAGVTLAVTALSGSVMLTRAGAGSAEPAGAVSAALAPIPAAALAQAPAAAPPPAMAQPAAAPAMNELAYQSAAWRIAAPRAKPARPSRTETPRFAQAGHRAAYPPRSRPALAEADAPSRPQDCDGTYGAERARCMYPEVVQSDEALRRAYADAVNAGVSRQTLSPLRNRWAQLRRRALIDPDQVATGYRRLAGELQDLRTDRSDAGAQQFADGY